jgi:hypothetical protein
LQSAQSFKAPGVVKSLGGFVCGPVVLIHTQEIRFLKNKRPTSVVESYKTTNGHKAVVLMSVVGNGSFLPDDSTKYRTLELP